VWNKTKKRPLSTADRIRWQWPVHTKVEVKKVQVRSFIFAFPEPCIVIHTREKYQQDAHFS
jgi:hypothetical protein